LGSTSLTEGAVFGARAGTGAVRHARQSSASPSDDAFQAAIGAWSSRFGQAGNRRAAPLRSRLQQESWTNIGPVRTEAKSDAMEALIAGWRQQLDAIEIPPHVLWNQDFIEFVELTNMLDVAQATALAARERDGSVGSHVRLDRPDISILARPYSTVVARSDDGGWSVRRVAREKTPLGTVVAARLQKAKRLMQARMLRWLPGGLRDRALERRYRAVMG
jgi:succinate dehydrogenase/fumarate reductase flavoprotein subunit